MSSFFQSELMPIQLLTERQIGAYVAGLVYLMIENEEQSSDPSIKFDVTYHPDGQPVLVVLELTKHPRDKYSLIRDNQHDFPIINHNELEHVTSWLHETFN